MDLAELQTHWDAFGRTDPLWAILTRPDRRGGRWEMGEFFGTGEAEVAALMARASELGRPAMRRRALDFGCGVGRLTQALCHHFDLVCGVDIAPSMIAQARQLNRHGASCHYLLNEREHLRIFDDGCFDLIYSARVLQHVRPDYAKAYVAEMVRLLAPGGLLVFQLPSELAGGAAASPGRTVATDPLPAGSFRAELTLLDPPASLSAGAAADVRVLVRNAGDALWPCLANSNGYASIRVGNHWLFEDGTALQLDDGRVELPRDLAPGESAEVTLHVAAPLWVHRALLQVDLVQEGVAWFADRGSPAPTALVDLDGAEAAPPPASTGSAPFEPLMLMHGVPRDEVLAVAAAHGGRVLRVDEADAGMAGGGWRECVYYLTR